LNVLTQYRRASQYIEGERISHRLNEMRSTRSPQLWNE
jgi:hypothetical protein